MRQGLVRPANALFPMVCLLGALAGRVSEIFLMLIFYFALQLLTLCAPGAFRNAAARETGERRVDRRFGGAIMQIILGGALFAVGIYYLLNRDNTFYLLNDVLRFAACALCIIIEQTFEERLYALGRGIDGRLLALIANLLLLTGFLLTDSDGTVMLCAAGAGVIAGIAATAAVPFKSFSLLPRNCGYGPKAAAQELTYPLLAAALMRLTELEMEAALGGWILWRLARTTCRRSAAESRPMNLFMVSVCAAAYIAAILLPEEWIGMTATACLLALVSAAIVFLAPSWRLYAGIALLLLTEAELRFGVLPEHVRLAALAMPVLAAALNVKKAFLRQVRA